MKVTAFVLLLVGFIAGLTACVANSKTEILLRFTMGVIDIPCKDVLNSIPVKLQKRDIPSVWINENAGTLSVGPFTEKSELGEVYSMIRHAYELSITCASELSTNMTGTAALEGLNADNRWVPITDAQTVDDVALKFLRSLDW